MPAAAVAIAMRTKKRRSRRVMGARVPVTLPHDAARVAAGDRDDPRHGRRRAARDPRLRGDPRRAGRRAARPGSPARVAGAAARRPARRARHPGAGRRGGHRARPRRDPRRARRRRRGGAPRRRARPGPRSGDVRDRGRRALALDRPRSRAPRRRGAPRAAGPGGYPAAAVKLATFVPNGSETVLAGEVSGHHVTAFPEETTVLDRLASGDITPARGEVWPLADVRLLAPVPRPRAIFGIGLNYADHAAETGAQAPEAPIVFQKPPGASAPPDGPVRIPAVSRRMDYEGEMAIVMGAGGSVAGFAVADDVTARDLQRREPQWT